MSKSVLLLIMVFNVLFLHCTKSSYNDPPLKGPYYGQTPPGTDPEIFAPGLISNGFHEQSLVFASDGSEAFYTMSDNSYSQYVIVHLKSVEGIWEKPVIADFSGIESDLSPFFSPIDNKLFFTSKRSYPDDSTITSDLNIWYVQKENDMWTEALYPGFDINTAKKEGLMSIDKEGNVYFQSLYDNNWDIYHTKLIHGIIEVPERIEIINSEYNECAPYVAPDGSYLLFHSNRKGGYGKNDLYISYKNPDDSWREPVNLGNKVNSTSNEFNPTISPDGKYIFYSSFLPNDKTIFKNKNYNELLDLYKNPKNGYATLYWVDSDILDPPE